MQRIAPQSLPVEFSSMKTTLVFLIILFAVHTAFSGAEISLREARRSVEEYVARQGYTDAPTTLKAEELDGSSFAQTPLS